MIVETNAGVQTCKLVLDLRTDLGKRLQLFQLQKV